MIAIERPVVWGLYVGRMHVSLTGFRYDHAPGTGRHSNSHPHATLRTVMAALTARRVSSLTFIQLPAVGVAVSISRDLQYVLQIGCKIHGLLQSLIFIFFHPFRTVGHRLSATNSPYTVAMRSRPGVPCRSSPPCPGCPRRLRMVADYIRSGR